MTGAWKEINGHMGRVTSDRRAGGGPWDPEWKVRSPPGEWWWAGVCREDGWRTLAMETAVRLCLLFSMNWWLGD